MTDLPPLRTGRARKEQGFCHPVEGLELPFGLIEGAEPGPCLLVTAGVHGSEFCSIEAALRLLRLEPEGHPRHAAGAADPQRPGLPGAQHLRHAAGRQEPEPHVPRAARTAAPASSSPTGSSRRSTRRPTPTSTCTAATSARAWCRFRSTRTAARPPRPWRACSACRSRSRPAARATRSTPPASSASRACWPRSAATACGTRRRSRR